MDYVFARYQVDRMLARGEIDFMVLSHWHLDHLLGHRLDAPSTTRSSKFTPRPHGARKTGSCCRRKAI